MHVMLHLTQGERKHLLSSLNSMLKYCSMYNNISAAYDEMDSEFLFDKILMDIKSNEYRQWIYI